MHPGTPARAYHIARAPYVYALECADVFQPLLRVPCGVEDSIHARQSGKHGCFIGDISQDCFHALAEERTSLVQIANQDSRSVPRPKKRFDDVKPNQSCGASHKRGHLSVLQQEVGP